VQWQEGARTRTRKYCPLFKNKNKMKLLTHLADQAKQGNEEALIALLNIIMP
jgi:hypothetical protein